VKTGQVRSYFIHHPRLHLQDFLVMAFVIKHEERIKPTTLRDRFEDVCRRDLLKGRRQLRCSLLHRAVKHVAWATAPPARLGGCRRRTWWSST